MGLLPNSDSLVHDYLRGEPGIHEGEGGGGGQGPQRAGPL